MPLPCGHCQQVTVPASYRDSCWCDHCQCDHMSHAVGVSVQASAQADTWDSSPSYARRPYTERRAAYHLYGCRVRRLSSTQLS